LEWTAESEKEKNAEAVRTCFDKGYIRNLEINYDGCKRRCNPYRDHATCIEIEGKIQTMTICRDITERKEQKRPCGERIQIPAYFESAYDSIFLMDQDIFIDCNQRPLRCLVVPENRLSVNSLTSSRRKFSLMEGTLEKKHERRSTQRSEVNPQFLNGNIIVMTGPYLMPRSV